MVLIDIYIERDYIQRNVYDYQIRIRLFYEINMISVNDFRRPNIIFRRYNINKNKIKIHHKTFVLSRRHILRKYKVPTLTMDLYLLRGLQIRLSIQFYCNVWNEITVSDLQERLHKHERSICDWLLSQRRDKSFDFSSFGNIYPFKIKIWFPYSGIEPKN